jgi:WD40 repeat protein
LQTSAPLLPTPRESEVGHKQSMILFFCARICSRASDVPLPSAPDSKAVLFISTRNGVWNIFKQAIGQPTAELFVGGEDRIFGPRLSPDGSEILYLVMPRLGGPTSEVSLMRLPVAGGPLRLLLREAGICDVQCARFSSNRCILTQQQGGGVVVYSLDPLQGKSEALLRLSTSHNFSLSPDGSQLAIIGAEKPGRIQLFSLASRHSREIVVKGWAELRNINWSADGRTLFVPATKDERTVALLEIDMQGNAWQLLHGSLGWAIPSPDSRYLAFTQVAGENNVWMIQDF